MVYFGVVNLFNGQSTGLRMHTDTFYGDTTISTFKRERYDMEKKY